MIKKTKDHSLKVRELIILQWVFEGPSHELRYCWTRFWDFARRLMRITYFFKPSSQISSSTPPKVIQNQCEINMFVKNLPFWLRGVEILACRLQKTRQIHWKNWHVQNWPSILNERCKHFKKNLSFYDEFLKVPFTNCVRGWTWFWDFARRLTQNPYFYTAHWSQGGSQSWISIAGGLA